jgi:hypothetical protein
MAPLRAELSKILLEITHYSRKNTALFEKKFQDFLVEQMKTVG